MEDFPLCGACSAQWSSWPCGQRRGVLAPAQRRAMAPAFTPRNVVSMARHIILCTERARNRLEESCGTEIDVLHQMRMLSLEIAATSMFSMEASTFGSELRALVSEYTDAIGRL